VIFDLSDVKENLGDHWNPTLRDTYTGVCEVCSEEVPQCVKECPICGIPVVWRSSQAWKRLYGAPKAYIRLLSVVEPEEESGVLLCQLASVPGFANQTEADRWRRAVKKLSPHRVLGIARHAVDKKGRNRAAICYAVNLVEKIVRQEPHPKAKPQPRPVTADDKGFMI